jgi:hypothetical protein
MRLRVAVDLARRGEEEAGALGLGEAQEMVGARHAGEHGVLGIRLVMRRRGGAGEVVDLVDREAPGREAAGQGIDDVVLDHVEARLALQVPQVRLPAGEEAVEADDASALAQEDVAQVGADEAGASGDEHELACLVRHHGPLSLRLALEEPRSRVLVAFQREKLGFGCFIYKESCPGGLSRGT